MDLLRDCVNYLYNYFTFVTNIQILPGMTVGGLMLGVCSFAVVIRLIVLPYFNSDSTFVGGSRSGSGKGK